MNDEDINKLASVLTINLATKEDIKRLEGKIDQIDSKADTILQFAEAVEETTTKHETRLSRMEKLPIIAHQLKASRSK